MRKLVNNLLPEQQDERKPRFPEDVFTGKYPRGTTHAGATLINAYMGDTIATSELVRYAVAIRRKDSDGTEKLGKSIYEYGSADFLESIAHDWSDPKVVARINRVERVARRVKTFAVSTAVAVAAVVAARKLFDGDVSLASSVIEQAKDFVGAVAPESVGNALPVVAEPTQAAASLAVTHAQ